MSRRRARSILLILLLSALTGGCQTNADRGTFFGTLLGAGTGAIIGNQTGNRDKGALIGGVVGGLAGNAIGSSVDEMEARNREMIEQRLGRKVRPGAVTIDDVINMSKAGVDDELIINHIRAHGVATSLTTPDIILLKNQEVSPRVIATMQNPPIARPVSHAPPRPRPVFIEEHYYPHHYSKPRPHHNGWHHCSRCRRFHGPGAHINFSFGH